MQKRMQKFKAVFLLALAAALPGRAEFLQMDISIFGMD
jgi:hypothetical protein